MSTLFIVLVLLSHPPAAFEYRESAPGALFPFVRAVSDHALVDTGNPAFLPFWGSFHLGASYSRPYALEGLNAGTSHPDIRTAPAAFRDRIPCSARRISRARTRVGAGRFSIDGWRPA